MEKKTTTKKAAAKPEQPVNEKPTYEQLENYAKQLSIQAQRMHARIQDLEALLDSKRMEFLFKVIENPIAFSEEFTSKCAQEIENALTIPEQPLEKEEE